MLGDLMDLRLKLSRELVLGLYGDHLPLLTRTFERAGFNETATDYVIWGSGPEDGHGKTTPLAPEQLGQRVLAAAGLIDEPGSAGLGAASSTAELR